MRKICQLMKNARLLAMVLILLTTMVLSGCQNYQEGWTPYDPLALAEKQPESAPATTEPGTTSGQVPFLIWGKPTRNLSIHSSSGIHNWTSTIGSGMPLIGNQSGLPHWLRIQGRMCLFMGRACWLGSHARCV